MTYPFAVTRNMAWAAVQLNGKDPPLPFMIDTGSSGFAILRSKAQELGLPKYGKTYAQSAVGRIDIHVYGASVVLGGAVREPWLPLAGFDYMPPPMQGLIPLARFRVMGMDFDTRQVLITSRLPKALEGYEPLDLDVGRGAEGSLDRLGASSSDDNNQLLKDYRPVIDAEFNGEPVKLMVDTGSDSGLFLFPDYVRRKGLWDHFPRYQPGSFRTLARTANSRTVRAERLKIGKLVFANPIVTLGDPADSKLDGTRTEVGLIGMEFLRRLNFISDPQRRKLWIRPNSAITDGYRYDRAGAEVAFEDGVARVVELNPGSPADRAGLKLGDRVTGWRGADGLDGLSWALKGAPGSKVEIQLERDGQTRLVAVVLEEAI
ncbi:aspartyl protease family protein [Phenylobacterium sp.]|uniref:aspartyl protease family protein n=1 Tax=Phenylobacterium sp. TaxID=1871053 RepID=UPI0027207F67|nr:aspartyl protease family protein [Phenylobacterium sp.]MDO8379117.1 aspartyl protease family protein [Phenylobacterium sp.]